MEIVENFGLGDAVRSVVDLFLYIILYIILIYIIIILMKMPKSSR